MYDSQFNDAELHEIKRLRQLDSDRSMYSWAGGIATVVGIFVLQIPFHGVDWIHTLATYGCIPAGIAVGLQINSQIYREVTDQFKNKWDQLYYQRAGSSPAQEAARAEILRLTDGPWYYGLSEERQRAEMDKINRKYGL